MKKSDTFTIIILNIFSAILQSSFFSAIFGYYLNPNLYASICFSLVLNENFSLAYISALFGGIFLDIISGSTLGLSSLGLCIFVWVYQFLYKFYLRSWVASFAFATIFFYLLRLVLARSFLINIPLTISAVLSALFGYLLSFLLKEGYEKVSLR